MNSPSHPVNNPARAKKYFERYAQGVVIRDHSLELYDRFLENLGEKQSLEQLVHRVLRRKEKCRLLDLGCGNANALREIKGLFGKRVHTIGMDLLSPSIIQGVDEFIEGDVHAQSFPGACDLILSFRSIHEMGGIRSLIPAIASSLEKGGRAYCWIRMRESPEGKTLFVGEMNEREENDLHALATQSSMNGCTLLLQPVEVPIPVLNENAERNTMIGGYVLLLHRPL